MKRDWIVVVGWLLVAGCSAELRGGTDGAGSDSAQLSDAAVDALTDGPSVDRMQVADAAPDAATPDAPPADLPAPDAPPADLPAPDAPPADLPVPDAPPADLPVPDAPPADLPLPDAPPADLPAPDAPPADLPAPDAPPADGTVAGSTAAGSIPAGLPAELLVGLFEDHGGTWMSQSGVDWGARYRYFTKGWVNNWGWGNYDGSWGQAYMTECDNLGFVPAIQYYQMNGEPGGGEDAFLAKAQDATTMATYFGDFKILMQRAKDFGKPVMILLEADGCALLQQQSGGDPTAYAAVAASGLAELAGLPDTVAGWGMAFLQLRKSVGATNAILGIHISAWASGKDIAHFSVTDPLGPEVDAVYQFLAPLGLAANQTGETYDLLVGDPLDRDADYYMQVLGQDRWWDASDAAPIASKSFNRYAEWLRLFNVKASRRWVLWQIPLGNSNHLNVPNNGGPREGYKDNRPEYFFGPQGDAHRRAWVDQGVIGLLFGAGTGGQSWYTNDYYTDGELFMKSRAGAFLNAGGLPIQ